MNPRSSETFEEGEEGLEVDDSESPRKHLAPEARRRQAWLERYDLIPGVIERLKMVDESLGRLFETHYLQTIILKNAPAPEPYRDFFLQVSNIS